MDGRIPQMPQIWCSDERALPVVIAAAAVGGWWLKRLPGAVNAVGGMELSGLALGLAAVALCLPGPVRRRASLLAATVLLCAVGVAVAYSQSAAGTIVF
jgi:hypothetical protein